MLSKASIAISGFALLLSGAVYPCDIVIIGGVRPTAVRQGELSGTVVGSGRIDLMGKSHDKERSLITVAGATISIQRRTDEFVKKGEFRYPPGVKPPVGNLKDWQCGGAVAEARTDQAGQFKISQLKPGNYCLDITDPQPGNDNECGSRNAVTGACNPLSASFIIDVMPSAPKATLIADISPRWPDCSGGSSLQLKPLH